MWVRQMQRRSSPALQTSTTSVSSLEKTAKIGGGRFSAYTRSFVHPCVERQVCMLIEAPDGHVPQPGLWSSISEALRGSHQDYTRGNLNRAILLLAIPMVLEMVLESLSPSSTFSG